MQNIVVVSQVKSYLLMSIRDKLKKMSYQVSEVAAEIDAIHGVKDSISAIFIYADEELIQKQPTLLFIKDQAIADDMPIFLAGELQNVNEVKDIIPKNLIRLEFLRPLNVNALVVSVDNFMKQYTLQVRKKILAVDDSGAMLRTIKDWLDSRYHVHLANSGAMAIKYLALNRPDLILLDYEMPVVDGKQVLEMIRTETDFADIPVIFLTAKGDQESVLKVQDLKPDGYLLKSMTPQEIIKAIDDFFEMRKAQMI